MSAPDFAQRVLTWFDRHGRHDLPWQRPATPYRVWVSEVMLQQTQVATVIPYFQRFMARFPDIEALAASDIDDVLHLWAGLGYYARARNLHRAAGVIVAEYGGDFPSDFEAVHGLPGVGRSTAGAILSLACGQRHPILDGNVKRVLTRYAAEPGWPGTTAVANRLWALSDRLMPDARCGDYNQALMDLGATLCTRTRPACDRCPVAAGCAALAAGNPTRYPHSKPKRERPQRHTYLLLLERNGELLLERRPPHGIWGGLWSLPECGPGDDWRAYCRQRYGVEPIEHWRWDAVTHTFTHFQLHITPLHVRVADSGRMVMEAGDTLWYNTRASLERGLPAPIERLLEQWRTQRPQGELL